MRFCEDCGSQLADNSQVCAACFNRTDPSRPVAAAAAPVAPPAAGLQPPMAAALTYLAGFITGIIFLVIDPFKADRFVRFHAFQSIFFNVAWIGLWIAWMIVGFVLGAVTKGLFFFIQLPLDIFAHGRRLLPLGVFDVQRIPGKGLQTPSDRRDRRKAVGALMTALPARLCHMLPSRAAAKPTLLAMVACLLLLGGCKHAASPNDEHPEGPSSPAASSNSNENIDIFDPKLHPGATVVHTIDPHTLSESQVKFGVAPKRDPSVEYQPDIILMENGDKAIKSVASDGLTWTFDANAPQVSDFQEGKIVFATGRAVGRVLSLNRQGDSVKVILGPVQLTDVIRNGNFQMNENIDLNNMISYVAPDYPQPPDPDQPKTSFNRQSSPDHMDERMVLSRVSRAGKWTPATMVRSFADGHRDSYYHMGSRWSSTRAHAQRTSSGGMGLHFGGARMVRASGQSLQMPGAAGVSGIQPLQIPLQPFDPPKLLGQLPLVNLAGGRAIPMAGSDGGIGVEYDYDKDGLKLRASGYMTLRNSG